jgi:hypothetical protein
MTDPDPTDTVADEDLPEFAATGDDAPEDAEPVEEPEPSPKDDEVKPG